MIFTASHNYYADAILDYIDPKNQYISHRLYRDSCFLSKYGVYIKDLRIINREMKHMIIIDNQSYSFAF